MDHSQTLNFKLVGNSFVKLSTKFSPYRNIVQPDRPRASIIFNWREKWHSSSDIPHIHSLTLWWVRNLLAKWTFVLYSVSFPTNGKWWREKCLNVRQSWEGDYCFSAEVIRWIFLNPGLGIEGFFQVTVPFVLFSRVTDRCMFWKKELSPLWLNIYHSKKLAVELFSIIHNRGL